jgi:pre-mRNA-processing factor 39
MLVFLRSSRRLQFLQLILEIPPCIEQACFTLLRSGTVYQRCKEFVESRDLSEILRPEEQAEYETSLHASSEGASAGWSVEAKQGAMRQQVTASIDRLYQQSYDAYQKRYQLEYPLHRTFFHVQPVEAAELTAWSKYLTVEEEETAKLLQSSTSQPNSAVFARAIKLFERCLIVCAMYPDFWNRYAQFLERHGLVEQARQVYVRGTSTFCKYSYVRFAQAGYYVQLLCSCR